MREVFSTDAVVIGAGAVGLAIARALAQWGAETVILEKNTSFGMETSSRNSEVIHAGIYYPADSLKARLCIRGRHQLYEYCESHAVGFKRLGKLIVATNIEQNEKLIAIVKAAAAGDVRDILPLTKTQIRALEPDLSVTEGLISPSTGIIDSHQYMLALIGDAENLGADLVRDAEVRAIECTAHGYRLTINNRGEDLRLDCHILVNSAGLWAQRVAGLIDRLDRIFIPPLFLAKGNYVTLSTASPFRHLVYPVPEHGGLGIHLTLDMGGRARFGPNVEWLANSDPTAIDYTVPGGTPELFAPHIAAYWPAIDPGMLAPGYSGVRPKIAGAKDTNADFRIDGPQAHGLPGLVNLFAIESPGLTSSLAIADHVVALLK
jgi:L-2-hydroxyglutarate oxidase LhgO